MHTEQCTLNTGYFRPNIHDQYGLEIKENKSMMFADVN